MTQTVSPELLDREVAGRMLGVHPRSLFHFVRRGQISGHLSVHWAFPPDTKKAATCWQVTAYPSRGERIRTSDLLNPIHSRPPECPKSDPYRRVMPQQGVKSVSWIRDARDIRPSIIRPPIAPRRPRQHRGPRSIGESSRARRDASAFSAPPVLLGSPSGCQTNAGNREQKHTGRHRP